MGPVNWKLPASLAFTTKDTAESGRGVFSINELRKGEALLTTTTKLSPLAHVVLRPYRREVCAQCFLYDRGREWKIRDIPTGTAFCSEKCRHEWALGLDGPACEASVIVETFIKATLKRQNNRKDQEDGEPTAPHHAHIESIQHIQATWKDAEVQAADVVRARKAIKPTKSERATLRRATDLPPDPDILAYVLSGVLAAHKSRKSMASLEATDAHILMPSLFSLAADPTVFLRTPTTISPLSDYTSSYLVLLAILPFSLLDLTTSNLVINLASRASHNAFSIRPEGTSDGDESGEFLGWGVWPEASFFNHSCRPNVRKERKGRFWTFWVDTDRNSALVRAGEQLCITYLGGEERDLSVSERRQRLSAQWGFECECERCIEESGKKL